MPDWSEITITTTITVSTTSAELLPSHGDFLKTGFTPVDHTSLPETESTCSICAEPFAAHPHRDGETPVRLPCKHIFGSTCILLWLTNEDEGKPKNTCPLCRRVLFAHSEKLAVPNTLDALTYLTRNNLMPEPPFIGTWRSNEQIHIRSVFSALWVEWAWDALKWTNLAFEIAQMSPVLRRDVRSAVQGTFMVLDTRFVSPMELYVDLVDTVSTAVQMHRHATALRRAGTLRTLDLNAVGLQQRIPELWVRLFARFIVNRARGQ